MTDTYVSHLECSETGQRVEAHQVHGLSEAGRPLLVRYRLDRLKEAWSRASLAEESTPGFWRYAPLLPVQHPQNRISLGEVATPLIPLSTAAKERGLESDQLVVKDEGRLPTGSFKDRGLALAVSMARELGLRHLAMPSNGNAGAALAAYARRAGLRATVFCPEDSPDINLREIQQRGAEVWKVDGLIDDCGKIVREGVKEVGWFDVSTLKEPYRIEGKKTMGLELAEQLGWRLPQAIFYPTGGGTGMIGMWKAFQEMTELGWIKGNLPRMVVVQAEGCAPIVRAWEEGTDHAERWEDAHTVAAGIRVPAAIGDSLILRAVRESGGFAMAISDDDLLAARDRVAHDEGLLLCPEGAATYAAWQRSLEEGLIDANDRSVLFNCATGLKYPMPHVGLSLSRESVDFGRFGAAR